MLAEPRLSCSTNTRLPIGSARDFGVSRSEQNPSKISCQDGMSDGLKGTKGIYYIKALRQDKGDLKLYSVENGQGDILQAHKFEKCSLSKQLYCSRKRRVSRLRKADMVLDEIQTNLAKYLITPMPASANSEQHTPRREEVESGSGAETQLGLSEENFPPLGSPERKQCGARIQGNPSRNMPVPPTTVEKHTTGEIIKCRDAFDIVETRYTMNMKTGDGLQLLGLTYDRLGQEKELDPLPTIGGEWSDNEQEKAMGDSERTKQIQETCRLSFKDAVQDIGVSCEAEAANALSRRLIL